jgi:hypothetical protein
LGDGEHRAAFWFVDALAFQTFHRTPWLPDTLKKDSDYDITAVQA